MTTNSGDSTDKLARAYGTLKALKANIPEWSPVSHLFVIDFHRALDHLAALGVDVEEFRIDPKQVKPRITSSNSITGEVSYSDEPEVDRHYLLTKLDSVLTYFELITIQPQQPIRQLGFRTPSNS
jgi:hypothetical protein